MASSEASENNPLSVKATARVRLTAATQPNYHSPEEGNKAAPTNTKTVWTCECSDLGNVFGRQISVRIPKFTFHQDRIEFFTVISSWPLYELYINSGPFVSGKLKLTNAVV